VITPLEMELLGVPQGVMLRSTAKYAIADITIDFAEGTDIYWARQQVAERYGNVAPSCRPAWTAGWRRFPRRCRTCSCSPSKAAG
jgi:cobalt-zinc-cadmium resistance protein CzcA